MDSKKTHSGISPIGSLPWGSHFCHFYENRDDLADTLVPYIKAGLENGEACQWVTSPPLELADALAVLRNAVPDLDARMAQGQVDVCDYRIFYTPHGRFDPDVVLANAVAKKEEMLRRGYPGLRMTGNAFWIQDHRDFESFTEYEARLNDAVRGQRIVILCSYCLGRTAATDVLDVARNHEFALARRHGDWQVVENASLKATKEQLRQANAALERRVAERTEHLRHALSEKEELLRGIQERDQRIRRLVESNIIGVFFWNSADVIADANDAFLDLVGYSRDDLRQGRLGWAALMAPEHCAADAQAIAQLKTTGSARPYETTYLRKDGSRVPVLVGRALIDDALQGGVAFVLDISERRQAEQRQDLLMNELNHRVKNTLATVLALSTQTFRTAETPEAFRKNFESRLFALTHTHDILNQHGWEGATLREVLSQELSRVNGKPGRVTLTGTNVSLGPIAAITLGLAFHELATNAEKYGALSLPSGNVRVSWEIDDRRRLHITWQEEGGPPVLSPRRRGFGSQLIERILPAEIAGEAHLDYLSQGVRCTMDMSLDRISSH